MDLTGNVFYFNIKGFGDISGIYLKGDENCSGCSGFDSSDFFAGWGD